MLRALHAAPGDAEPTTDAEDAGAEEAWAEYRRGDVLTAEHAKQQLLG